MTTNVSGSAKIYTFPARGRCAVAGQREESRPARTQLPRSVMIASGSGWYHDEAIREAMKAEQSRKD